jgi:hypothetical protein
LFCLCEHPACIEEHAGNVLDGSGKMPELRNHRAVFAKSAEHSAPESCSVILSGAKDLTIKICSGAAKILGGTSFIEESLTFVRDDTGAAAIAVAG